MTTPVFSNSGFVLNVVLLVLFGLSWSSPTETRYGTSVNVDEGGDPPFSVQDFLSQFLSTLNLTRLRSQTRPQVVHKEPLPEYMLDLYNRFANDHTAAPSASIVRSFKNEGTNFFGLKTFTII